MYSNDNQELLVRALKVATANAQKNGFNFDFKEQFALLACPDWTISFIDFNNDTSTAVKAENSSGAFISIAYYDNRLKRMPSKILRLDRQNEYDCLIPVEVYRSLLEKMCMSGGVFARIHHSAYKEAKIEFDASVKRVNNELDEYRIKHNVCLHEIYNSSFYNKIIAEHKKRIDHLMPYINKTNVEIIPRSITSIEALCIWLDMNECCE